MPTIEVQCGQLARALAKVIPHAHPKPDLPKYNVVRLQSADGHLFTVATDRYTLAAARIAENFAGKPVDGFLVTIPLAAAKTLERLARHELPARRMVITHSTGRAMFRVEVSTEVTWECGTQAEEFPDWQRLFRNLLHGDHPGLAELSGVNPKHLARFAKADVSADALLVFKHGAQGEPTFVLGEEFIALMAPRNLPADGVVLPEWVAELGASKVTDKRAVS
jgi:hypothetical protein